MIRISTANITSAILKIVTPKPAGGGGGVCITQAYPSSLIASLSASGEKSGFHIDRSSRGQLFWVSNSQSAVYHLAACFRPKTDDREAWRSMANVRLYGDVALLSILATCTCCCFFCEQFRKTRNRIPGNDVGKRLHFNVLVVESGLGSSQVMMPEMPK